MYGHSLAIGHVILTLMLALVGGLISLALSWEKDSVAEPRRSPLFGRLAGGSIGLGLLLIVLFSLSPNPTASYFPEMSFATEKEHHKFMDEWFSKHLRAMGEPSLSKPSRTAQDVEVYRFLWLPSFDHPVCVRIEKAGTWIRLQVVILDGQGGYEPGIVVVKEDRGLTRGQWDELVRRLEKADYWKMPSQGGESGSDGAEYVLEGVKNGTYHVVVRWSPSGDSYADLCEFMLGLSGIKIGSGAAESAGPAPGMRGAGSVERQ